MTDAATELRITALAHAIDCYHGPDDDTIPVLRHWLRDLRADALCTCTCGECVHAKCCWCGKANPYSATPSSEES